MVTKRLKPAYIVAPIAVGLAVFFLVILGVIEAPILIGIAALASGVTSGVGALVMNYYSRKSVALDIGAKLPYIYLFFEVYLLAGLSPDEAIGRIAKHLELPSLDYLYRYISTGTPHTEAFRKLFGPRREWGTSIVHLENLLKSGVFGLGGLSYISEMEQKFINDIGVKIEKIRSNLSSLIEIYAIFGLMLPSVLIFGMALVAFFGGVGVITLHFLAFLTVAVSLVASVLLIALTKGIMREVKL